MHFSWRLGCSYNVVAVLRTRTTPSSAFNVRAVDSDAHQYINGCDYIRDEVKGHTRVTHG